MSARPCVVAHITPRAEPGPWRPDAGWCRLCWLTPNTNDFGQLWGGVAPAALEAIPNSTSAPVPLPCVHEGHTTRPPAGREQEARTWVRCDAGKGSPPGVVCRCECNSACPSYEPAENE